MDIEIINMDIIQFLLNIYVMGILHQNMDQLEIMELLIAIIINIEITMDIEIINMDISHLMEKSQFMGILHQHMDHLKIMELLMAIIVISHISIMEE